MMFTLSARPLEYRSDSRHQPPRAVCERRTASAEQVLRDARNGTATVWRGDYHQAKQVLSAVKKRLSRKPRSNQEIPPDPAAVFHRHRLHQSQNSRLANMLLVEIGTDFALDLPRAPDVAAALAQVYGADGTQAPFLLPLNRLLGFIGAWQWQQKGVEVAELGGRVYVPFGVFSPVRGEYLSLLWQAPLPENCRSALDIGTGSGVLALLLARRGIGRIAATDNNPRAVACARANIDRFGLAEQITVYETDLFPPESADLIVCNPPWLPVRPTSDVETALYDPDHAMLDALLHGAAAHLNTGGELWLILSDLAEHLGLREHGSLPQRFQAAGWRIVGQHHTQPQHGKARAADDALAFARMRERTTLYRLQAA